MAAMSIRKQALLGEDLSVPDATLHLIHPPTDGVYARLGKPIIDRVGAAVLLVLLAPVLLAVALAVLLTLGRPVLYLQDRVGKDGVAFQMLKFRTMRPDRRERDADVPPELDRRRHHKTDADPRHTAIGRFLRRFSLDELPQLLNVLKGDMSLVGPRPELVRIVARYEDWQHARHRVKPGITGLWQVTERGTTAGDMQSHTSTDIRYVRTLSLLADVKILLLTLPAMLGARGRGM
jgi:lipopolysaccharide/colanic/teichoic acid biosynthesis glycosyltransferase